MFESVAFDQDRYKRDMQIALPRKEYAIFFTPRSGSSWLTSALKSSGRMGDPDELFNPDFMPSIAATYNADDIQSYIDMARRKRSPGGVFGFEITYLQMLASFGSEAGYLRHFPTSTPTIWLVRENIIEQAVSLAKSVATAVYHSASASAESIARADDEFRYDASAINHWLHHILEQETATEKFIRTHHIEPLRLTYERMMADKQLAINAICGALEEPPFTISDSPHRKIGTDKNMEFSERFRKENADFMREIEDARRSIISALC